MKRKRPRYGMKDVISGLREEATKLHDRDATEDGDIVNDFIDRIIEADESKDKDALAGLADELEGSGLGLGWYADVLRDLTSKGASPDAVETKGPRDADGWWVEVFVSDAGTEYDENDKWAIEALCERLGGEFRGGGGGGSSFQGLFSDEESARSFIDAVEDLGYGEIEGSGSNDLTQDVHPSGMDERGAGAVETKGEWNDPVYLALMALAEEHNGIDTGMGYQGATVFQFDDEDDAEAFMDAPGIDDLAAGLKGPERHTESGALPWWTVRVTWAEPSDDDGASDPRGTYLESAPAVETKALPSADEFVERLNGVLQAVEAELDRSGDFAGNELAQAAHAIEDASRAAVDGGDDPDWAAVAEHLDEAATFLDSDEVTEDGSLASTVTALDAFREEALGYAKETKSMGRARRDVRVKSFDLTADQVYELSDDVLEPFMRSLSLALPDAVTSYRADVSNAADEMSLLSQGLPEDVDGSAIVSAVAELTAANRDLLNAMPTGDFADSIVDDFSELPTAVDALGSALDSAIAAVEALDRDLEVSVDDTYTQEDPQDDSRSVQQRVTLETSVEQVMGMLQALVGTWAQLQDAPAAFVQWQIETRDAVREAYEELNGVEKSVSKHRRKYYDYPSYAGMPFGSPTLSTRYRDIPAGECAELSYSVREAGEALEAASEIYLQRAASAARGERDSDDSAPDVAAMNTLNGVAVQLESLADRLLAIGDPGDAAAPTLHTGPVYAAEAPTRFYSWPDCLPSCLAAVEGALGSVTGDAEYLEVAAQLTVVRDMLRGLLEECEEEEEEGEEEIGELGETKSTRVVRTKGRLGRLSAVSDKVDYAVDALAGFSRGTPGVTDALRILKDMQTAIEDGDRDAFGEALDELGGVRDEVDGDLDEGETGEFPHELAWLLSDLTDAYYGNKSAELETVKGHSVMRTKKASRRSRFGDERSAMDTLAELSTQLDRVTDEAWTGRRRIVDSKARAALETAVAAASFVAESVGESISNKAPLSADQLAEELGRASDALRVLEKSGDPWATTFRDDLSEFGSLLGRSASALDRYLDEAGEASGDEDPDGASGRDETRGSTRGEKLRRRQLAEVRRAEAEIVRKADRAARLAREVQGLERLLEDPNDEAFARAVTAPQASLAARRAARVRAY